MVAKSMQRKGIARRLVSATTVDVKIIIGILVMRWGQEHYNGGYARKLSFHPLLLSQHNTTQPPRR